MFIYICVVVVHLTARNKSATIILQPIARTSQQIVFCLIVRLDSISNFFLLLFDLINSIKSTMADCSISHHWLYFFWSSISFFLSYRVSVGCMSYCVAVYKSVPIISIFKNIRLGGCFVFQYQVSYFVGKSMFNVDCL